MQGQVPPPNGPDRPLSAARTSTDLADDKSLGSPATYSKFPHLAGSVGSLSRTVSNASANDDAVAQQVTVSGRNSPSNLSPLGARRNQRVTTSALASDPRYKRYSQQIDKCLATFNEVTEWADFTAFLSRLHKALQATTSPPYPDIPHKLVIAKRLAQGLNPALPNGVHQRSLDVYREIFNAIEVDGLSRDLQIWSSGLLPFFQYAATAVRPAVLELYEVFYLPLGANLRPITKALAIALLPGIEEETGDFYDRVFKLLDEIARAVDTAFFAQCLFLTLITNPTSRISALNYLNRRLAPDLKTSRGHGTTAFAELVGMDSGLMIRGLSAALQDNNVLVRRGVLDFLNTGIPVSSLVNPTYFTEEDCMVLMSSACSIVLRKDLSLSRRLYTWLLGDDEDSSAQIATFREEAMPLVIRSFRANMDPTHLSPETTDSYQPYRVFVALLDKWEIGYPLSLEMAYPCLEALRADKAVSEGEDTVSITSQAIYNAVEPFVVWSAIFNRFNQQTADKDIILETLGVMQWLLQTFPINDREVSAVHAPLLMAYLVTWLNDQQTHDFSAAEFDMVVHVLEMLVSALATDVDSSHDGTDKKVTEALIEQLATSALTYYTSDAATRPPAEPALRVSELAVVLFQNLTSSTALATLKQRLSQLQILRLLRAVLLKLKGTEIAQAIQWDRDNFLLWTIGILKTDSKQSLVQVTEIAAELEAYRMLRPALHLAKTSIPKDIQVTAFRLLRRSRTPQHAELISIILRIHNTVSSYLLEHVVMECLCRDEAAMRSSVAAFSALWNVSIGPRQLPLDKPMFYLLDQIDTSHPGKQRAIQAWFKQEPGGFLKMVDRILCSMLSKSPTVNPGSMHVAGRDYECLLYQKPADTEILAYHVSKLHEVIKLGGRPLRIAMEERVVREEALAAYSETVGMPQPCHYSHFVMETLVRFLFSRGPSQKGRHCDTHLHIKLTHLLKFFCSQEWHFTSETLSTLKHDMINRLSFAVAKREIDLQEELLKLLQRLLLRPQAPAHNARKSLSGSKNDVSDLAEADQQNSALLLQAVHSGITDNYNSDILASWLEFSLVLGNSLPSTLRPLLFPLIDVISREIQHLSSTVLRHTDSTNASGATEDNLILLLRTVDSLVHYTLGDGFSKGPNNLSRPSITPSETTGILGYVFSSTIVESEITNIENGLPKTAGLESMRSVISLLMGIYQHCIDTPESRIEEQTRASLSSFYRLHSQEFLESVIDVAFSENPPKNAANIVDIVSESAHQVVEIISSAVSRRLSVGDEQRKRNFSLTTETKMLHFLRNYIAGLEAPIAVQAGSFCLALAKTLIQSSNIGQRKRLAPGIFEVLTAVLNKVSSTSALTDRRYRKDVQDTFLRTLEVLGGALAEPLASMNQGDALQKDIRARVIETRQFLIDVTAPNLRAILIEEDRIAQASTVILNAFVLPTLRSRSRADATSECQALDILNSLSRITPTLKLWKTVVLDIFTDSSFFEMRSDLRGGWRSTIATVMDQDREKFSELLVRVGTPLSGNFFSNKEQEALTKAANIRRLSLVLFSAEANQYLIQLPHIQERLVEIIRTPTTFPKIYAEVYLCLRVLLCRFSSQHLTNFWPLILSELIKIFEDTMIDLPKDNSDHLTILLAACKFLDLLIALQMEDFQIHQWMFLTDTVDAADGESLNHSESILDRLATLVLEAKPSTEDDTDQTFNTVDHIHLGKRRPVLANIYTIQSLQALRTFLLKASSLAYEGIYQASSVDWEYIEQSLEDEIFRAV